MFAILLPQEYDFYGVNPDKYYQFFEIKQSQPSYGDYFTIITTHGSMGFSLKFFKIIKTRLEML